MTHSSGISVTNQLNEAFGNARTSGSVRWIKVSIQDEALVPVKSHPVQGDQQSDWESFSGELLPKTPTYILYRLDTKNMQGWEWVLVAYVPDGSTVRERMLYASSRDNLRKQLGANYFGEDLYGSQKDEMTYTAFEDFRKRKIVDNSVLTASEIQYRREVTAELAVGTQTEYVHSVKFPMSTQAVAQLKNLSSGSTNLVQLSVDPTKETIELASASSADLPALRASIPTHEPRFTIYRWDHTHEGASYKSIVFIYSCTNNSPVKLKMLYSTVKAVAIGTAEEQGIKIDKKLEISEPEEISQESLVELLHPPSDEKKQTFVKPGRPGRGNARLTAKK